MNRLHIGRIIAFMLAILLCLNTVVIVGAAEERLTREVEFLKYFGILEDTLDEETLSSQIKLTRADFAQYFSRLINAPASDLTELYYHDVPQTYYAYEEITILTKMGYLSGAGNKLFKPEDIMQMDYCYALFLKAIGLEKSVNGDITEMQTLCMQAGILKGVSQRTGALTMPTLVKMLYNALFTECYENNGLTVVKGDDILLNVTRDMEYVKYGRVESVNGITINEETVEENIVKISGKEYAKPSFDMGDLLGRNVRFVYERPGRKDMNEGKIIWIESIDSSDVLEISVNPDCYYDQATGIFEYIADNGKYDKIQIPRNLTMIYNGKFKGTGHSSVLSSERYEITLIKDNNNNYTTAIVWQYRTVTVKTINSAEKKIYGKNQTNQISLNPFMYDKLEIINASGEITEFENIKVGDVLSIYESDDKKYCKVRITNDTLTGKVDSVKKYELEVGEKKLEFSDRTLNLNSLLGKNIKFYRDVMGFVVDYEQVLSSGEFTVGFMINAAYEPGLEDSVKLKIFDENGKFVEYDVADKVKANGGRYNSEGNKVYALFCDGSGDVKSQLVAYKLNADSKITEISTAFEDDGNEHTLIVNKKIEKDYEGQGSYGYSYYAVSGGRIGKNMAIDENTKFIIVPSDDTVKSSPEKFFRVGAIKAGVYPEAISYRVTTEPTFFEQYVLIRENAQSGEESDYAAMFDYMYQAVDEEGDVIHKAVFYKHDGIIMDVAIDESVLSTVDNFTRGDVLTYTLSYATGELIDAKIVEEGKNVNAISAEHRIVFGYANSIAPEGVMLGYTKGDLKGEILNMKTSKVNSVIMYDREKDCIYIGNPADLKAYDIYGNECSEIVAGFTYNRLLYVFAKL